MEVLFFCYYYQSAYERFIYKITCKSIFLVIIIIYGSFDTTYTNMKLWTEHVSHIVNKNVEMRCCDRSSI